MSTLWAGRRLCQLRPAGDATLAGHPVAALLSGPKPISVLERNFGGRFVDVTGVAQLGKCSRPRGLVLAGSSSVGGTAESGTLQRGQPGRDDPFSRCASRWPGFVLGLRQLQVPLDGATMMELVEARAVADRHVESLSRVWAIELALDDAATRDESRCWLFIYNSRAFLESGSPSDALAGNGPLAVDKASGQLHELVAARPIPEQLAELYGPDET